MKSDATQVLLYTGVAALINGVYKVQRKEDPVPSLTATGIVGASLLVVGGLMRRYDLVTAMAFVFLMSVLIARGLPMLDTANGLINVKDNRTVKPGSGGVNPARPIPDARGNYNSIPPAGSRSPV